MKNISQRLFGPTGAVVFMCLAWILLPTAVYGYAAWDEGCQACHGDFNSGNYVSNADATAWGKTLMAGHQDAMGVSDCEVCHQPGPRSPVYIGLSAGTAGYPAVSCLGCHGRAEDAKGAGACVTGSATTIDTANCGSGAGLRKHHASAGQTECAACHTNDGTVLGESFQPAYYFAPDAGHPNKPVDSCNAAAAPGNENKFGLAGLDNDGDLLYDIADPDCGDTDSDLIRNGSDNCRLVANNLAGDVPGTVPAVQKSQLDSDNDGFGNRCDGDLNQAPTPVGTKNVDTTDYTIFRSVINKPYTFSNFAARSDLNGSGTVDTTDYTIFRTLINKLPGQSGLACAGTIPCP